MRKVKYTPPESTRITAEVIAVAREAWRHEYMQRSAVDLVKSRTGVYLSMDEMNKLYYKFNCSL